MADSVIKYSDLIGADDTFDVIFENIDELKKELNDLAKTAQKDLLKINPNDEKQLEKITQQIDKLAKSKKELDRQEKKATKTRKKLNDLTDEELIQREKLKIANRERVQIAKQNAILLNKEAGQIEKLRAKLSLTTLAWKKLSKEELNSTKKGKELIKTKRQLTAQLKKLEKQTGDTRRNVGNYNSALGKTGRLAARIFVGRSIFDGLRRISGFFTEIIDKNAGLNNSLGGLKDGFSAAGESIEFAGAKILETLAPAIEKVAKGIAELPFLLSGVGAVISGVFTNISARIKIISLDLEKTTALTRRAVTFDKKNLQIIDDRLNQIRKERVKALKDVLVDQTQVSKIFNDAVAKSREEFKKFQEAKKKAEADEARRIKARENALKRENELLRLQDFIRQNLEKRIKSITDIQKKISNAEADLIEDQQDRLLRLEELKAKAINEQREKEFDIFINLLQQQEDKLITFYGENSKEVIDFREKTDKELLEQEEKNQKLSELQLEQSENRKIEIRKKFAIKAIEIETKSFSDLNDEQVQKELDTINEAEKKKNDARKLAEKVRERQEQDAFEKRKKREEELTEAIIQSSQKIGQAIVSNFEKQSDLAASLVEEQADAVDTQRERAEDGLANTLKFEKDELAKREGDRLRAEQKAKNAAKILALFNLVSAYAQSGDSNALQRGLVDFALLTALESAFTGFEEGGYTGDDSSNKKVKGVVHANEYVVTAADTERFGLKNKSGGEFGEAMSDYFNQQSPLLMNTYDQQNKQFSSNIKQSNNVDFSRLEYEVRAMRQAFQNQQKNDFDIERMTDHFVDIAKRVTRNRMTTVTKVRKRL